ncbi:MAG: hypothetical protein R3315_05085 [Woeseiaceae bacterium]|nr:hypothetical protein [Woeseiaceae bacterium]
MPTTTHDADPDRNPEDIVADDRLDAATKIKLLTDMRLDAVELQTATDENMPGDGSAADRLQRIDAALTELGADVPERG